MKALTVAFALLLLLLTLSCLRSADATTTVPSEELKAFCTTKCNARCGEAGYKDRCMKYCNICCWDCKCVPSGTYGRKDECACYRDKLNRKKLSKCP